MLWLAYVRHGISQEIYYIFILTVIIKNAFITTMEREEDDLMWHFDDLANAIEADPAYINEQERINNEII